MGKYFNFLIKKTIEKIFNNPIIILLKETRGTIIGLIFFVVVIFFGLSIFQIVISAFQKTFSTIPSYSSSAIATNTLSIGNWGLNGIISYLPVFTTFIVVSILLVLVVDLLTGIFRIFDNSWGKLV